MNNKFSAADAIKIFFWNMRRILNGSRAQGPVPLRQDPKYPDVVVCTIAVGPEYLEMADRMIRSLRKNGGFTGPVFVFSDNCDYFSECADVHTIPIPSDLSTMGIKQYKTWLAECIGIPFHYVLYLDADILIGKDLNSWIHKARKAADRAALVLFWDHASTGHYYHAGVVFINRDVGRKVLMKWRHRIWFKGYSRDQKALIGSIRGRMDVHLMPESDMNFLSKTDGSLASVAVFNHITDQARRFLEPGKCHIFQQHLDETSPQHHPT